MILKPPTIPFLNKNDDKINTHYLSAKFTEKFAVLTHFHLLNLLSQTSTITGAYKPRQSEKFSNSSMLKRRSKLEDINKNKFFQSYNVTDEA